MDDAVNRLARELAEAIANAVASDPGVEACHERARAAGYDMRVSLEAVIGFVGPDAKGEARATPAPRPRVRRTFDMSANDRRFLRSLRIAVDEAPEEVE